jgi:regulator of RNase E activity RraB
MNPIIKKMNREILEFIRHMDVDPGKERPVTFWFYAEKEENIYRLASRLQENGYRIECCEYTEISGNYLCIAETSIATSASLMDKLCVDMELLAGRFGVTFDGWETRIDPG